MAHDVLRKAYICMLNYAKMVNALATIQENLFTNRTAAIAQAQHYWYQFVHDELWHQHIAQANNRQLVSWLCPLRDGVKRVVLATHPYTVAAVDGSQIYPDRHHGLLCSLINIGTVFFSYSRTVSSVAVDSIPHIFVQEDVDDHSAVDCLRDQYELLYGVQLCSSSDDAPRVQEPLLLFDGSLSFASVYHARPDAQEHYFSAHIDALNMVYQKRIACAWYISAPASADLVHLLSVWLKMRGITCDCTYLTDVQLLSNYLKPHERTTVFRSSALTSALYPPHSMPCFFYMHTGYEIARVEMPMWLASDEQELDFVAARISDQVCKGNGYPIALAEAHEQAVVKAADRDIFYQAAYRLSVQHNKPFYSSQKLNKKQRMAL